MSLALGIDVGTSGVRTAVMDGDDVLSMARADHPAQDPSNIDADGWWQAVATCLKTQVAMLHDLNVDPLQILNIAVDGTSGSMVLTDRFLNPVSPALMYNSKGFDIEAAKIARFASDAHITKGSNSALARAIRLVSLASGEPHHLLHQADFIAAKLMNMGGHSDYNNALKTGFDPETETWPDWIERVIDPALLPEIHAPGTPIAAMADPIAEAFGLSKNAVVHAGTTDSIAAFLACAPIEEGIAVTSLGSTLAIKVLSTKRIDDPSVGLYSHRLGDFWLVGGASNTGGAVLKAHFTNEELVELSRLIDPSVTLDLDFYPLLTPGERFPNNDPTYPPKMTPRPKKDEDFLQAMFEGMADIECQCYRALEERGGTFPSRIFSAGGGASNEVWTALRKKAIGLEITNADQTEAAFGAAKLSCAAVG